MKQQKRILKPLLLVCIYILIQCVSRFDLGPFECHMLSIKLAPSFMLGGVGVLCREGRGGEVYLLHSELYVLVVGREDVWRVLPHALEHGIGARAPLTPRPSRARARPRAARASRPVPHHVRHAGR